MARRSIPSLDAEFVNVMSYLGTRSSIPPTLDDTDVAAAKRIHRSTHSLILWRFRLRKLPNHGRVFIEEIASDALQILPQVLMGYRKPAKLLTRGIIENVLRHIYFSDHPIEFSRMNRDQKWFMSMESLWDYAKTHPIFMVTETKFDAFNRLNSLYSELSAGVHGRTVRDFQMLRALKKIKCQSGELTAQAQLIERCAEAANFVIASFHKAQTLSFQAEDRQVILRTMNSGTRQIWQDLDI
jgi:hypothetical protein